MQALVRSAGSRICAGREYHGITRLAEFYKMLPGAQISRDWQSKCVVSALGSEKVLEGYNFNTSIKCC